MRSARATVTRHLPSVISLGAWFSSVAELNEPEDTTISTTRIAGQQPVLEDLDRLASSAAHEGTS